MGGADGENGEGGARDRNSLQCLQGIRSILEMKKKAFMNVDLSDFTPLHRIL